jgi:hemolysin III
MTSLGPSPALIAVDDSARLYDSRRSAHYDKPVLRGWLHLIWFGIWLVAAPLTIGRHHGTTRLIALAIYLVTLGGLLGTSALYHRGRWSASSMASLQRLDHVMIFFLIAGSATPEFLLGAPGWPGRIAALAMWTVTIVVTTLHLRWMAAPEWLVGTAFLVLGWGAGLGLPWVWLRFGPAPVVLVIAGGLLYTVGALSYHRRWPDPKPVVFGYHEVFHAFVCAAATCQFVAIALLIA